MSCIALLPFTRSLVSQGCLCNHRLQLHLNDSCLGTLLASPHLATLKLLSLKSISSPSVRPLIDARVARNKMVVSPSWSGRVHEGLNSKQRQLAEISSHPVPRGHTVTKVTEGGFRLKAWLQYVCWSSTVHPFVPLTHILVFAAIQYNFSAITSTFMMPVMCCFRSNYSIKVIVNDDGGVLLDGTIVWLF